eukprot:4100395-Alexandrium_andersonii.AAC.1
MHLQWVSGIAESARAAGTCTCTMPRKKRVREVHDTSGPRLPYPDCCTLARVLRRAGRATEVGRQRPPCHTTHMPQPQHTGPC